MKKVIVSCTLLLFSFFYTYLCSEILIIIKNKSLKEKKSINAKVSLNEVMPGKSGKKVSVMKTFNNMNKYGKYDDSLYVFHEEKPSISIDNYYDKYITKGNKDKKNVSLIYTVSDSFAIKDILKTLKKNNVNATFFIDGKLLEIDNNLINKLIYSGNEIELLNYDGLYEEETFKNSLDYLSLIKNEDNRFCFSPYKRDSVLNICSKYKLHTIVPGLIINNNMLYLTKENLTPGLIIKMPNTVYSLNTTIDYIKSRNYKIVKLEKLLEE